MTTATLINVFEVPAEREKEFLSMWEAADSLLRSQGGYLVTRLHRALMPDARFRFVNVAELDSVERWREVIGTTEFRALGEQMSQFRPSPGLYQVIREHHRDT
jgi:heme oxygenase (mycobilin-producing)